MQRVGVEPNQQYFIRRLAQEETAAKHASDPRVRDSHLEMARRYRSACEAVGNEDAV